MLKSDLWCGYCGTQEFTEIPHPRHPDDSRWSAWECIRCQATFEDNPGYGYFTSYWGNNDPDDPGSISKYSLHSGKILEGEDKMTKIGTIVTNETLHCDICGDTGNQSNRVERYILYEEGVMGIPEAVRDLCSNCISDFLKED